jgi:hypothetical protein
MQTMIEKPLVAISLQSEYTSLRSLQAEVVCSAYFLRIAGQIEISFYTTRKIHPYVDDLTTIPSNSDVQIRSIPSTYMVGQVESCYIGNILNKSKDKILD